MQSSVSQTFVSSASSPLSILPEITSHWRNKNEIKVNCKRVHFNETLKKKAHKSGCRNKRGTLEQVKMLVYQVNSDVKRYCSAIAQIILNIPMFPSEIEQ